MRTALIRIRHVRVPESSARPSSRVTSRDKRLHLALLLLFPYLVLNFFLFSDNNASLGKEVEFASGSRASSHCRLRPLLHL